MTADTNPPAASATMSATADECNRLRAENTGLHHTVSQLSGEVGRLRLEVSCLRAEREKMRVRLFDFAWEMAGSGKGK